ncbi:MAG: ATPase [Alphaproteobacteria bacterium]|nr:ATPase [Alphaproteobacteria bacterium]
MKRFYATVAVGMSGPGRFSVLLDAKPLKTPRKAGLLLPSRELAEAIAGEWRGQGVEIDSAGMVLTKCANTAIDQVTGHEAAVVDDIVAYANDLLCYRAETPVELLARQQNAWDPLLAWFQVRFGIALRTGTGVSPIRQDEAAIATLRAAVGRHGAFVLTALHRVVALCGSLVLGLGLLEGRLTAEEAFAASRVDEAYQAEKWGRDALAEQRAGAILAELGAAARFLQLAKAAETA